MSKKVLLVNPSLPGKVTRLNMPLGLLYLGTWLSRNGYEVNILDAFNYGSEEQFYASLDRELHSGMGVFAVGLSVMTAQVASALAISRHVMATRMPVSLIWGGVHPTLYPEQVVRSGYADYVVVGEGEKTTVELLEVVTDGGTVGDVAGVAFRVPGSGEVVVTGSRTPMDIDELSAPDYGLLEDFRRIADVREMERQVAIGLPLLASRGCAYRCSFCCNPTLGIAYRLRQPEKVLADIEVLLAQGVRRINFMDDDFFGNAKRLTEVVGGIIDRGLELEWVSYARISDFNRSRMSDELLEKVKISGCRQLFFGVESGSQRVLDMIRKGTRVEDALVVAERLDKVGIDAVFSYITGFPGESAEEIEQTIALSTEIAGINNTFRTMGPFIYHPYAGSELYHRCVELGLKEPIDLEGWVGVPDIGGGAMEAREYPAFTWMQYPMEKLVRLNFYCWMAGLRVKWSWLTRIARSIGSWRCRKMQFAFPVEMWAVKFARQSRLAEIMSKGKF